MIEIHEKAIPRMVGGIPVVAGTLDGMRVYVARNERGAGWGLTPEEAAKAWTETSK